MSYRSASLIRDDELASRGRRECAHHATSRQLELEYLGVVMAAHIAMRAAGRETHAHGRLLGWERRNLLHGIGKIDRRVGILIRRHHHMAVVGRDPHAPHLLLRAVGALDQHRALERVAARVDDVELSRALRRAIECGAIGRDGEPLEHLRQA